MAPPELSLCSPLPSALAMNNSPPEGPIRFTRMMFLANDACNTASARVANTRKRTAILIPDLLIGCGEGAVTAAFMVGSPSIIVSSYNPKASHVRDPLCGAPRDLITGDEGTAAA